MTLEVLRPTSRRLDEVRKVRDYITIPTPRAHILASPHSLPPGSVEFRRETISGPDAILELTEAGLTIPLAELYRDG